MNDAPSHIDNTEKLIKLLAKEGTIKIIRFISENEKARYRDLNTVVKSGTTLNKRLDELISNRILLRKPIDKKFRMTEYTFTEKGINVLKAIEE